MFLEIKFGIECFGTCCQRILKVIEFMLFKIIVTAV